MISNMVDIKYDRETFLSYVRTGLPVEETKKHLSMSDKAFSEMAKDDTDFEIQIAQAEAEHLYTTLRSFLSNAQNKPSVLLKYMSLRYPNVYGDKKADQLNALADLLNIARLRANK